MVLRPEDMVVIVCYTTQASHNGKKYLPPSFGSEQLLYPTIIVSLLVTSSHRGGFNVWMVCFFVGKSHVKPQSRWPSMSRVSRLCYVIFHFHDFGRECLLVPDSLKLRHVFKKWLYHGN